MKKLMFIASLGFLVACEEKADTTNSVGSIGPTPTTDTTTNTMATADYPYEASYSKNFSMGNSQHAMHVLQVWKGWDMDSLGMAKEHFADSVTMVFADGTTISANRDSVMQISQQYRSNYDSVSSSLEAIVPLKIEDKNETWVSVWGKEFTMDKKGKKDSTHLHETWRFNKDGKIYHMHQYTAKPSKPMTKN